MSKREAILIVSRAVALYLFVWALDNLTYLPGRFLLIRHWTSEGWHSYDMLNLEFTIFRAVALLAAALMFYECGPRVEALLLPKEQLTDSE